MTNPDKPDQSTKQGISSDSLNWSDPLIKINGLGELRAEFLNSQGYFTVGDILLRAPLRYIDRKGLPELKLLDKPIPYEVTAVGSIEAVGEKGFRNKRRFLAIISDGTGHLTGVWFNRYRGYKEKLLPGRKVAFSGKVTFFDGPQMVHPQVTFLEDGVDINLKTGLIPVYPSGLEWEKVGLNRRNWQNIIKRVIQDWDGSCPVMPEEILKLESLPTLYQAIRNLHVPDSLDDYAKAIETLKFTELFHHQMLMVALRRRRQKRDGIRLCSRGEKYSSLIESMPFELSPSQQKVLDEIWMDIETGQPMHRLLQGEVGAGKTVIAFAVAAMLAGEGYQTTIMAPTELLARQHYQKALEWCEPIGIKPVLISAGRDAQELERARYEAGTGSAQLIIGTHALFYEKVQLSRLGLVVIDEQQRFGVNQRARLVRKGERPHVLLMTATPIPRTLSLTYYGDVDISYLQPIPGKVRQVKTRVVSDDKRDEVFGWLRDKLRKNQRGYLVYPVIDEGPAGLEAAEARFKPYQDVDFKGIPIALLHGRLPVEDRIRSMEAFRRGDVRLLMATAVIEVGVDVPEANIMVIENVERFGLAQLHQLRGRVGRSGKTGFCILLTPELEGEPGFERLKMLETCENGLQLAEEDLKLRGGGDPIGARQSGMVKFKMADLSQDINILRRANHMAEYMFDKYPSLEPFPELREKIRHDYRARPRTLQSG